MAPQCIKVLVQNVVVAWPQLLAVKRNRMQPKTFKVSIDIIFEDPTVYVDETIPTHKLDLSEMKKVADEVAQIISGEKSYLGNVNTTVTACEEIPNG
jgi:hypothetical protein